MDSLVLMAVVREAVMLGRADASRPLMSVKEASKFLGWSEWFVRSLVHRGQLTAVRYGRLMRFEQEELERFVAASRQRVAE
jgi:excisionase family DNA binding protein